MQTASKTTTKPTTMSPGDSETRLRCPCCGETVVCKVIEIDGETTVGLFHTAVDASYEALAAMGYELGIPSGKVGE